jgi:hypothetical protein
MEPGDIDALMRAMGEGEQMAREMAEGQAPDVPTLHAFAEALEALRIGVDAGKIGAGWIHPTVQDVEAARRLAVLAGGPMSDELRALALRVYRVTADPQALYFLCEVLGALMGETPNASPFVNILLMLERAEAFLVRGGEVAGFVPTAEDLARVRRLRAVAFEPGAEAAAERQAIVAELTARMPTDDIARAARALGAYRDEAAP